MGKAREKQAKTRENRRKHAKTRENRQKTGAFLVLIFLGEKLVGANFYAFCNYEPEIGWIMLWGEIFRRMSRILCYPATCSPQFMRLLQGTDISKEFRMEPPAPIIPWGCGHWAVFCSSTENLRQLSKNLPTTNSATITIWEGFLDICC